jgi:hypothetical protein
MTATSGAPRYFKWPYQATVMKMLEAMSSRIVGIVIRLGRKSTGSGGVAVGKLRFRGLLDSRVTSVVCREALRGDLGFVERTGGRTVAIPATRF